MTQFSKFIAMSVLGLGLGLAVTPVYAQESGMITANHLERVSKLIGSPVYNEQGQQFGTIDDVLVTPSGGEPEAVLSVGGFLGVGSKLVEVPLSHVRLEGAKMMMAGGTKQDLTQMPNFEYYHMSHSG